MTTAEPTTIPVTIEGRTIQIDIEITKDDDTLKRAMSVIYPGAANSNITRDPKTGAITITKIAQYKGCLADEIIALEEKRNPIITLYREISALNTDDFSPLQLADLRVRIEKLTSQGDKELATAGAMADKFTKVKPSAATSVPTGF